MCAQESHRAGRTEGKSGVHFHMAIKLNKVKRWNTIRRYIKENWGINVYFSSKHCNYYSVWVYVTKEDDSYVESPNHPDLTNQGPPRTLAASQTLVDMGESREVTKRAVAVIRVKKVVRVDQTKIHAVRV